MIASRLVFCVVLAAACTTCTPAAAHAFLDRAMPAVGSTVHVPPRTVRLSFSEALEPAFSRVNVEDSAGKVVDAGDGHVDAADRTILMVGVPSLPPGTYRVRWRVVSIDTHVTEGDYTFTIAP
jgi:methionine-rich copper-binding protein CopC